MHFTMLPFLCIKIHVGNKHHLEWLFMKISNKKTSKAHRRRADARRETVDALLAQALFCSLDQPTTPCQGEVHQRGVNLYAPHGKHIFMKILI